MYIPLYIPLMYIDFNNLQFKTKTKGGFPVLARSSSQLAASAYIYN